LLPIDALLPELCAALAQRPNLVLLAEPGAGKTTRVPSALLDSGLLGTGECWVLEPRRLAARLAAARVAEERGESLGDSIGYAVRFEQKVSKATRIRFVTEGLLLRRLQADPTLRGITAVILDEFHERSLHTDLALLLLRRLQQTRRPELHLIAMSATLEPEALCTYLDAPLIRCAGRQFPVAITHRPLPDDRPLGQRVAEAVASLYGEGLQGHSLVFLPGAAEIRQAERACAAVATRFGLRVLPLHGSLAFEAQQAAIAPSEQPKLLLSTNVAESSVTLDGVAAVIDSGLGREASHSSWSGLSGLRTVRISRARCVQRAGRAGRQGPGRCLRLFTEGEFHARPEQDQPELMRSDLAEALLLLHGMGLSDLMELRWFEAPPGPSVAAAEALLCRLGALDGEGRLTTLGKRMLELPLHPRLARLVVAGEDLGIPDLARLGAALMEVGNLEARQNLGAQGASAGPALDSDLLLGLDQYHEAEAAGFAAGACRAAGLDAAALRRVQQTHRALRLGLPSVKEPVDAETRLLQALCYAYPDRVARLGGGGTYALSEGGGARLDPASRLRGGELLLALEAEARGAQVLIRRASRIEPEWLLEAFPERLREDAELAFQASTGKVERRTSLWYDAVCLETLRRPAQAGEAGVATLLAQALKERGLGKAEETLDRLLGRCAFLAQQRPELGIPELNRLKEQLFERVCQGAASFRELEGVDWAAELRASLGVDLLRLLETWAPDTVALPRRRVKVNYGEGAPWVESRLQDFLGLKVGPRVAGGAVPLVLHLLAPNGRAVQVTTDLAGFWQRAYQELRPQLSRRYPRHAWPQDPLQPAP